MPDTPVWNIVPSALGIVIVFCSFKCHLRSHILKDWYRPVLLLYVLLRDLCVCSTELQLLQDRSLLVPHWTQSACHITHAEIFVHTSHNAFGHEERTNKHFLEELLRTCLFKVYSKDNFTWFYNWIWKYFPNRSPKHRVKEWLYVWKVHRKYFIQHLIYTKADLIWVSPEKLSSFGSSS